MSSGGQLSLGIGERRGRLAGGAATAEALESSRGVLAPNQAGKTKGLQQYYTPVEAAEWIARVTGRRLETVDLTAGDGALLAPILESCRYGVELDADQIASARAQDRKYQALHGDLQQLYPLLAALGVRFKVALLNPPFGLPWSVPGLGEGNSAELTVRMARALLGETGMGVVICGAERFERELRALLGEQLFAVVRVESLFRGTKVPCSLAFWREGYLLRKDGDVLEAAVDDVAGLTAELARQVGAAGNHRFGYWSGGDEYATTVYRRGPDPASAWAAVQEEHDARRAGRSRVAEGISLHGSKLRVKLSPYSTLALTQDGARSQLDWLKGFDRQPPTYFALRPLEWVNLTRACERYSVPISPAVKVPVEQALEDARQVTCPLYPVAPAQRLAFLADLAEIRCRKGDAEKGYEAGVSYPIECKTDVNAVQETRERQTSKGAEEYQVLVRRRALQVKIGEHRFDEGTEAMEYILAHFDVPDPGDLASQFQDEVAHWTRLVERVEQEIQAREPGFRLRTFQVRDLARLLVKVSRKLGGILAWEMGLGKALGQGVVARALELDGKLWDGCALFVMPQDLVPQFSTEMKRFFGVELIPVGSAGRTADEAKRKGFQGAVTAVEVNALVKQRRAACRHGTGRRAPLLSQAERDALSVPKVWAVTWFEALAITGRDLESMPEVKVSPYHACLQEPREASTYYDRVTWREVKVPAQKGKWKWQWLTSATICPRCGSDASGGWDGTVCRATLRGKGKIREVNRHRAGYARGDVDTAPVRCGYVHRKVLRKPAYSVLARTFKAAFVDEGTKIQGDDSLTSKSLRAFRAPFRVLSTGTPMKNYVHQLFWLLWWALGDSTPRFPYSYRGGPEKFLQDFGVTEVLCDDKGRKEQGAREKVLPEVSNLLYLWKMLCGAIVRRRMDEVGSVVALDGAWTCRGCGAGHRADVGEPWTKPASLTCTACGEVADAIVPITYLPVDVPFGKRQKAHYQHWLSKQKFARWFLDTHPDSPLQQTPKAVELLAASIGQLAKLEWATVDPTGDRDREDTHAWTPSRLKALQLVEQAVKEGRQVLCGSSLVAPGRWMAEQLVKRGIKAVHLTDLDSDGRARTRGPKQRAQAVMDFRTRKAQVLCTSVYAVALGHNLDVASVVILEGLPFDFAVLDQFIKRARRLTSKRPVDVYVLMPSESLTVRKWQLQRQKTDSSDLALDGRISGRVEARVDKAKFLDLLVRRGIRVDGTEVPEEKCQQIWTRRVA